MLNVSGSSPGLQSSCDCCAGLLHHRFGRRRFLHFAAGGAVAAALAPAASLAASGHYEAMLLSCIDPRFQTKVARYTHGRNLEGKYSQFNIAGAAVGVVAPAFKDWHKAFWDNLGASIQLHNIGKVIAINHRDCGAAKIAFGADAVADAAAETKTHRETLLEFRKQVNQRFPKLAVETGLIGLDGRVETIG
jgi:carbonic anhydrase